jgi:hypothetical protein
MGLRGYPLMAEEALKDQAETEQPPSQDGEKRERSSIQFPYLPLEEAITIAKGVHTVGGSSCQVDQLAAQLNQKPDTGSFRLKLGTTKMFGLATHSLGTVTLTPLGARICDSQTEAAAKAEAFLNIPLYKQVYEQFKGGVLPPLAGLETAMVTMGVAPKQKATARQVFHRSATLAGFFWSGAGRLVYPAVKGSAAATTAHTDPPPDHPGKDSTNLGRNKGNGGGGGGDDPAIQGLIKRLPPPDSDWPLEKQAKWLLAISHAFEVIYPRDDDGRSLKIEIAKD